MRQLFLALAIAAVGGFTAASCGSSGGSADMTMPRDMAVPPLNCRGFGTCVYKCLAAGQGNINTCQPLCTPTSKPGSGTLWLNAVLCGQDFCEGAKDMSNARCVQQPIPADMGPSPGNNLCDPGITAVQCDDPAYQSSVCTPCLSEARNFWVFDESVNPMNPGPPTFMCPMPTSADCVAAQTACASTFNACLNDM